jgi:hypothetical protein
MLQFLGFHKHKRRGLARKTGDFKVSHLIKLINLETYTNNAEAQIKAFHLILTGDFSSCPEGTRGACVKSRALAAMGSTPIHQQRHILLLASHFHLKTDQPLSIQSSSHPCIFG